MQTNDPTGPTDAACRSAMTPTTWSELHDSLTLALDALVDSPEGFCPAAAKECGRNIRLAMATFGTPAPSATDTRTHIRRAVSLIEGYSFAVAAQVPKATFCMPILPLEIAICELQSAVQNAEVIQ